MQTNSFKLHKLTKSMQLRTNSLKRDSSLNTPKISAMNSVAKSVKYNNLSFITGQQLCKLRRQPQESSQNPEYSTAKNNMTNIRKRYDQVNQQKLYLQNKIQRLTQERNKYLELQKQFQLNKSQGKQKVINLQGELQKKKDLLVDKQFYQMSMQQMSQVIKHDKIVYDKRKYDMQKYLKRLLFKANSIKQEQIHQVQQDDRTMKVYDKLIKKLDNQNQQRKQHLNSIQFRIVQKQTVNNSSVLRKSQMQAIAQTAMCQRDPDEKAWLKIFWTHKLLSELLQSKIQREMQKFSIVEEAFKNIKISTGVNNAKVMVSKFLSKQQIYGDLLQKITQNQKQIQQLKREQQKLQKSIKKNEQELNELQTIKSQTYDLREWLKQTQYYDQKLKNCQLKQMKLKQYLFKQFKLFKQYHINSNNEGKQSKKFKLNNKNQIKKRFLQHLNQLSSLFDQSQKLSIGQNQNNQQGGPLNIQLNQQFVNRLFRVKPHIQSKITPNTSVTSSLNDKNISEQFIPNYQEQQQSAPYDQIQTIEEQRMALLRSNQKFMKELKHKKQQQKKLIVQNLVKNTKQKVVIPVKKVQQPQQ